MDDDMLNYAPYADGKIVVTEELDGSVHVEIPSKPPWTVVVSILIIVTFFTLLSLPFLLADRLRSGRLEFFVGFFLVGCVGCCWIVVRGLRQRLQIWASRDLLRIEVMGDDPEMYCWKRADVVAVSALPGPLSVRLVDRTQLIDIERSKDELMRMTAIVGKAMDL